ncbi:hypothetical protein TREMEDRAFT_64510 [Tremella mesenterica DSM 1558]|uniref:uncharacterized protein n=1 Tax=Tremella mesenterica (strain ATCC 24925 / CBS 8224 / DSM 1558 / NBRC 9311 / NRRL Y-6157 / RJB 2259-6 / UBC 559-6) TaxID=578456 RepID=UPI0003F491F2|nr:uncharacterized protein TREMEDRAFT_64510 [Tremella mesenterica DSM 1558]EIW67261.1 hypothetical protein TREMEDRAFT_64510 [Tremella mesenterica DSM 1558]
MSSPIPINTTPPSHPNHHNATPTSSISLSPQTPFSAPFSHSTILRSLSFKSSPPKPLLSYPFPQVPLPENALDDQEESHDEHDSFEFADMRHMRSSWRRAVSMSVPNNAGIGTMLGGFGGLKGSPPKSPVDGSGLGLGLGGCQGGQGVLADNAARGQGVLRRLSIGGFSRPAFLSPPVQPTNLPAEPPLVPTPQTSNIPPPSAPPTVQTHTIPVSEPKVLNQDLRRATTLGPDKARRLSDGRKRGVSPMGERMLREHGHF